MNRAADVAIAGGTLLLASPLLGLAALAVKLDDGGPILYRQTRVGKDGVDFELLKLRTMVVGAEKQGAGYAVDQGDSRITRAGRVLRRLSLDELPQLWNVIRGDMSVIGPRPTLRYQVERYDAAAAPPARGEAGHHRVGPGARTRHAAVGGADRARRLVRRAPVGPTRRHDPRTHTFRALRRDVQRARRAAGASRPELSRSRGRVPARRRPPQAWRRARTGRA